MFRGVFYILAGVIFSGSMHATCVQLERTTNLGAGGGKNASESSDNMGIRVTVHDSSGNKHVCDVSWHTLQTLVDGGTITPEVITQLSQDEVDLLGQILKEICQTGALVAGTVTEVVVNLGTGIYGVVGKIGNVFLLTLYCGGRIVQKYFVPAVVDGAKWSARQTREFINNL